MKRIKDLKTRRGGVQGISQDSSVEEAVCTFLDTDVSSFVVFEGEKLVGIFTKNDLVRCCAQHPDGIRTVKVSQYMKRNPYTASVHENLDDVIEVMIEKGFRHVPILEHGRAAAWSPRSTSSSTRRACCATSTRISSATSGAATSAQVIPRPARPR